MNPRLSWPRCTATAARGVAAERIDWSQIWNPGPVRVFTDDELRRAGQDRPSRTLLAMVLVNLALTAWVVLQVAPSALTGVITGLLVGGSVTTLALARRLWSRPERRLLSRINVGVMIGGLVIGLALAIVPGWPEPAHERWVFGVTWFIVALSSLLMWFLAMYRSEQIAGRLREMAEREQAVEMARQLATAQIQPHFLFNSLASLQHWVQAKDDRAAPMLDALTGFLRATLPLFNQARLRLGDEVEAVRRYLQVMQLRLGDRLHFEIEVDAVAAEQQVPPGLLLTLVENAVEHGVLPSLRGASVQVRAVGGAERTVVTVRDTGAGLAPGAAEGLGLANSRARLAQAHGAAATLSLADDEHGGCIARIELPTTTLPS